MIGTLAGQWVFTAVFVALAAQSLWSMTTTSAPAAMVHHLGGAVMAAGMAAMSWPQWLQAPAGPQVALYLVLGLASALALRVERSSAEGLSPTLLLHRAHHLVMLFAMSWMVITMSNAPEGAAAGGHEHAGLPMGVATAVLGVGLTASMIVLTVVVLVRYALATTTPRGCGRGPTGSCTLMGAGMIAMSWVMVAG